MENQKNYLHDGTEILKIEKSGRGMYTRYEVHLKAERYAKWGFKDGVKKINFDFDLIQCLAHEKLGPKLFDHINDVSSAIEDDTVVKEEVVL